MWLLVVACGRVQFVEVAGEHEVPSLAGCDWMQGEPVGNVSSAERDGTWTYDAQGRLQRFEGGGKYGIVESERYSWDGACLESVETTYYGYTAETWELRQVCDRRGTPVTSELFRVNPPADNPWESFSFTNAYDALGQLVRQDEVSNGGIGLEAVGLLSTVETVWTADGQPLQVETLDVTLAQQTKRLFYWDHTRLLGWEDRGPQDDPWMERLYAGNTLLAQYDYEEDRLLVTTEYLADRGGWPTQRVVTSVNGDDYRQEIVVDCGE